jgi:TPR repeat protein
MKLRMLAALVTLSLFALVSPAWAQRPVVTMDIDSLQKLARSGNTGAQRELAKRYLHGKGGATQNYAQALIWLHKAAESGDADAELTLAGMYRDARGVQEDSDEAEKWYRKAAEHGNAEAQVQLAGIYESDASNASDADRPQDLSQARSWYQKAAEQGNAEAERCLAQMYLQMYLGGEKRTKDAAQARIWYQKAADQGDGWALVALAGMYQQALGGPQDYARARTLCQEAVDRGNDRGQICLGQIYENGWGVPKDDTQALIWYRKAGNQGNSDGDYMADELERRQQAETAAQAKSARTAEAAAKAEQATAQRASQAQARQVQTADEGHEQQAQVANAKQRMLQSLEQARTMMLDMPTGDEQTTIRSKVQDKRDFDKKFVRWCNDGNPKGGWSGWEQSRLCDMVAEWYGKTDKAHPKYLVIELKACSLNDRLSDEFCSMAATFLEENGRASDAKALLQIAPACRENCLIHLYLLAQTTRDTATQISAGTQLCNDYHAFTICADINKLGVQVDVAAAKAAYEKDQRASEQREQEQEAAAEERRADARERTNALRQLNDQVSQGGTAILNTGNEQAAAIRAIGDANAAAQRQAEQQRVAAQQAQQRQAMRQAAAQQKAQQTANQYPSSAATSNSVQNGGGNSSANAGHYASPLSANCIRPFWDPKFYNWLSFENNCGQAINLTFTGGISGATDNLGLGQATNTGWSKSEVTQKGIYNLYVCPAGYIPVDSSTNQMVNRLNQTFTCKQQ